VVSTARRNRRSSSATLTTSAPLTARVNTTPYRVANPQMLPRRLLRHKFMK
jgi:hypothetical protein